MIVQVCPPPTHVGAATLLSGRSTSLNSGRFALPEDLSGLSPSKPRLAIRKRVLTSNKRIPSPLTESLSQNQTVRAISSSLSEADTDASENFGHKLQRYKCIEEEEKRVTSGGQTPSDMVERRCACFYGPTFMIAGLKRCSYDLGGAIARNE
jgi:hypothetical protein